MKKLNLEICNIIAKRYFKNVFEERETCLDEVQMIIFGVLSPYTDVPLHRISEEPKTPYSKRRYQCDETKNTVAISGFRREAAENCALQGYYAASSGNFLPTFRDNFSVPSSGFKNPFRMGPTDCPERSIINCNYSLRNNPEDAVFKNIVT